MHANLLQQKKECLTPTGFVWNTKTWQPFHCLGHQHGRRFIVLKHQYDRRDVI